MAADLYTSDTSSSGPRSLDSITEMPRFMLEASALPFALPKLLRSAPVGDGHPVMVLPGFIGGDDSMLPLRRFLTRLNYKALPWLQGVNTGKPSLVEGAMRRFYRLHHSAGVKVSLIGQSLGGVFAREIAREFPDAVRSVITLGSPFAATSGDTTNPATERLFERLSGLSVEEMRAQRPDDRPQAPLTMPSTSIYSKEDGVVAWQTCIELESDTAENVRITGSHTGMAMNPSVLEVVGDRLAQDPDAWQPFDRQKGCRPLKFPAN